MKEYKSGKTRRAD